MLTSRADMRKFGYFGNSPRFNKRIIQYTSSSVKIEASSQYNLSA